MATPSLTLNKNRAAVGSPVKMTYRFDVAQDANIDRNYVVFVHVFDPDGEQLWQDDHEPAVPTSQWKAGQRVEYTRTLFIPNYPYIGEAEIRMGLYDPASGQRLTLSGRDVGQRAYAVANVELLPQSENIFLIFDDDKGWHPAEVDATNPSVEWQWTGKTATISFRNPKRDATLYLESDARVDLFDPPQQVTIKAGSQPVATFAADSKDRQLRTFPIAAAQFGDGEMAEITVEVDRTFAPGGGDPRELGIRVYHVFLEPK